MTWQEVLDEKSLKKLTAYRIELNCYGKIIMSPMSSKHAALKNKIEFELCRELTAGHVLTSVAVQTTDNVKIADVAWMSEGRHKRTVGELVLSVAPEVCVEIASPIAMEAMLFKRDLLFERGASEFWLCNEDGAMTFHGRSGVLNRSQLAPTFPVLIEV